MASLIKGYEYDIFISYRQKDNKHDGWVTEFVDQLKGELESTFKEEVSVYFDINPHDGLLETHEVEDSLKEKLKCLVFIPIISRTYCDPKSFAWEHEFKAFVGQASNDEFGLKVKLPNGNVASRVLPVRIYEFQPADIKLCESGLGGVLRGVEFIYKSAGVNRPLRSKEENPQENLNHTIYRDQINKVGNAIKEIISAISQDEKTEEEIHKEVFKPVSVPRESHKTLIITASILTLALIVLGIIFIPKLFLPAIPLEKSIAVLLFQNYSGDPNQDYMSNGLTDEIINHLYKIKSFDKVVSLSSVLTYKGTDKRLPQIADELKVNYILEGTYKKIGDSVRVTAQLIEPRNDKHLWQNEYDKAYKEIISIQADIALQIADQVKAFLTVSEKQNIQRIPTTNQEAYDFLQQAINHFYAGVPSIEIADKFLEKGKDLTLKAIQLDPNYADAYAWAGLFSLYAGGYFGNKETSVAALEALPFIENALELDQNNSQAHYIMGQINEYARWDYIKAEKEYLKVIEVEPNRLEIYNLIGEFYVKMNQSDKAIFFTKKALESDLTDPTSVLIESYILSGNKKEALNIIKNT